jgi:uncharacterized protein YebE (UPF0316 family)
MIDIQAFYDSGLFTYFILPLLIFLARICDVTIGTIRIVMVAKGQKFLAPVMGFFEVLIWIITMSKVVQNLDNWSCYIGYAGGFATGNLLGMLIEEKMALGIAKIQVITGKQAGMLIEALKQAGYGVTHVDAKGSNEEVSIIYTFVKRAELPRVQQIISEHNPKAFYTIEDVKSAKEGIFPVKPESLRWRKGK